MLSTTAESILLAVLVLATSIWVGGYIAIAVVARSATSTLTPEARVAFFRSLGRLYFWVGTPALIVALVAGGVLARDVTSDGLFVASAVVTGVLLVSFAIAVAQARRMTRLRQRLVNEPTEELASQVSRGGRAAGMLRGVLGILSIALVIMGSFLAIR